MDRADFKRTLAARVAGGEIEQRHADFLLDIFDSANRNGCMLSDIYIARAYGASVGELRLCDSDDTFFEDLSYVDVVNALDD